MDDKKRSVPDALSGLILLWSLTIGLALFLHGFFPVKSPVEGIATSNDIPNYHERLNISDSWLRRRVGKVFLVLIDALRADFVFSRKQLENVGVDYGPTSVNEYPKIGFLKERIRNDDLSTMAFVAKTTPPTVTLPRIKAMTTGSIPGFVDVILNFGSSELAEDNLVEQWKRAGLKMNMFGDDTWLKLFPNHFKRSDGTTSFFVTDFKEVDDNVTRHLKVELQSRDWDVTILHYLGLDHIGHLAGPSSSLIEPKLEEMSTVIETIYNSLQKEKSDLPPLVVVLGDHGMSDAGSHGGASNPEVMIPIVLMSDRFKNAPKGTKLIRQEDIVPALSYLTGIPIPKNNLGILIPGLVEDEEKMFFPWAYNAHQVAQVMERNIQGFSTYSSFRKFKEIETLLSNGRWENTNQIREDLRRCSMAMSQCLAENMLEYSLSKMIIGISIVFVVSIIAILRSSNRYNVVGSKLGQLLILLESLKIFSLGSTSFIEEQHQTTYFCAQTLVLFLILQPSLRHEKRLKNLVLGAIFMLLLRVTRNLNQTGDKWAHLPDLSDFLQKPENLTVMSLVHAFSLIFLFLDHLLTRGFGSVFSVMHGISLILVYTRNSAMNKVVLPLPISFIAWDSKGIVSARFGYTLFFINCIRAVRTRNLGQIYSILFDASVPVILMLGTPQNSAIFMYLTVGIRFFRIFMKEMGQFNSVIAFLLLGQTVYFLQGNSNGLATVDISAGYSGVTAYDPMLVSTLILINTYGGIILVVLSALAIDNGRNLTILFNVLNVQRSLGIFFFLIIVTTQRFHLFVWTVFSPKLLYEAAMSLTLTIFFSIIYFFYKVSLKHVI